MSHRLPIAKTYKLFIGGKFPRTESGRSEVAKSNRGRRLANYCLASKKDFRDSVVAARKAVPGWSGASAYLRGQILYRTAEMLEGRSAVAAEEIVASTGVSSATATAEVAKSIDRLVYYAGWADKYSQVFSSVNPVASPHFNFSFTEPTGVVVAISPDRPSLMGPVTLFASIVVSGNTCILLASERYPLPLLTLAEVIATSDVPGGVVNVLSASRSELAPQVAAHMDVNAIVDASGDIAVQKLLREGSATNMKRVSTWNFKAGDWNGALAEDPYRILDTVEVKTAWHPMGI
jgi:acyl-CoA reductase-like NAD-dependent aldehyde dehydrogenase